MKYLLSLSIRYDGSSHFAENHKYGTFPGISAGWNVHREAFFEKLTPVVNNFKIRGSWGKAGNDNLSLANTQGKYAAGNNYGGEAGLLNTVLANSDLPLGGDHIGRPRLRPRSLQQPHLSYLRRIP